MCESVGTRGGIASGGKARVVSVGADFEGDDLAPRDCRNGAAGVPRRGAAFYVMNFTCFFRMLPDKAGPNGCGLSVDRGNMPVLD